MSKNIIYHLSSCNTCQRIIKDLGEQNFELINIKTNHIDEESLDILKKEHGTYESLFNKRAMKYRAQELNKKEHSEEEWKNLILNEYTFLKRPVIIINGKSFIGNSKKVVEAAKESLNAI